ncbi:hypothetical protein EI94DRAFT_1708359 [Lactarius quietus]|nr:hypothetical protein EI94DRAFT_1708359 [Lactarius quietus]
MVFLGGLPWLGGKKVAVQTTAFGPRLNGTQPRKPSTAPWLRTSLCTITLSPFPPSLVENSNVFFSIITMPMASQPVDQVDNLAHGCPPRMSKTKAMHDAPWRSLKPKSFTKPKTSIPTSDPTVRHNKKCKVSSSQAQRTVALGDDIVEEQPRHSALPRDYFEDGLSNLPPNFACRKQADNPVDDESVESQSDDSKTLSSQDYESNNVQDDLHNLTNNELACTLGNEAVQWTQKPSQSTQRGNKDQGSTTEDDLEADIGHPLSQSSSTLPVHRKELTNKSKDEGLNPNRPHLCGPHNSNWPGAPYLPAGPGQRNICINSQLVHLKDILKHAIKCLTQDCAFKHGYIPIEKQTECLVRILSELAEDMNRPYYSVWVQRDSHIQRVLCDLGIDPKKPFHHPAIVNTIWDAFFKQKWGPSIALKNHKLFCSSLDTDAAAGEVELPPAMVAMAAVAVHASLDEKISGLDFNADTYEDSYNTFVSFLEEIRKQRLPAYHHLMSDLYKLVSSQAFRSCNEMQNAMWLLDMDGMDE